MEKLVEDKGYFLEFTYSGSVQPQLQVFGDKGHFPALVRGRLFLKRIFMACCIQEKRANTFPEVTVLCDGTP
jgi:hypothetical protein